MWLFGWKSSATKDVYGKTEVEQQSTQKVVCVHILVKSGNTVNKLEGSDNHWSCKNLAYFSK